MAQPVLEEPDFGSRLDLQGAAKQSGAKELSPLLMLCGFALANRAGKFGSDFEELAAHDAIIDRAASATELKLSKDIEPFDKEPLPTDAALRELLKAAGDSEAAPIDALLKSIDGATAKSTNGINLIDAISKEVGFSESLRFASAVGRRQGFKDISPELLMAGVFSLIARVFCASGLRCARILPPASAASRRSLKLRAGCTRNQRRKDPRCRCRRALRRRSKK